MPQHARLVILCGLPFSGKTTLAKALRDATDAEIVDIDKINIEAGRGGGGKPITPEQWKMVYEESYRSVGQLLGDGRSVIFDGHSFTREERDRLREIAAEQNATVKVVLIDIPEDEARRRWLANRRRAERSDVRDEDFDLVLDVFETPSPDENAICVDTNEHVEIVLRALR